MDQNEIRCIDCKKCFYSMWHGDFWCGDTKKSIPTSEPEDYHICDNFKNKHDNV